MWNCAVGAESGIENHHRSYYLLFGALLFCVLIYKAWGPLLLITLALVVVAHTCYSLLVDDSLFAPRSLVFVVQARQIAWELAVTLRSLSVLGVRKFRQFLSYLGTLYEQWSKRYSVVSVVNAAIDIDEDMNGRHRRAYSLSTTGNELVTQVSPIVKDPYRTFALNGASDFGRTSTPLPKGSTWQKDVQANGDLGLFTASSTPTMKKQSPTRSENRLSSPSQLRSDDSLYGPKGSPWGANNSPKLRDRPMGVKTVQTVAGPLLASTRYNIDPKLYTDISSPGITTRLTKYATEANNKLLHQSQYATGQFPKVNLNASPIPLLSPNIARARIPVTVRVAPPEIVNYSPVDSHQERSKMSPNSSPQELKESKSFPSVAKTFKKLPLKRHTSREDIMLDLAKKQRFERIFDGELENLEEMMQKRAREESLASDEDGSPQSRNERPLKRPKASSCHDVINSLSSSINICTGIKRKALDTSRCNTPIIEKHFKSSSTSPPTHPSPIPLSSGALARSREQLNVRVPVISTIKEASPAKPMEQSLEETKLDGHSSEKPKSPAPNALNLPTPKIRREVPMPTAIKPAVKLTDKLFMRAEPQANEKIKTLIEEQGKVEAKFTTDDKEEIKKEDIVNMRQNSMRLRLQSMFDAISGKSTSKIDPDVVIQAEGINPPASTPPYTSMSSRTSTTTVNTSPITTTIVPILKTDVETNKSPSNKHVTFNLPSSNSTLSSVSSTLSSAEVAKPVDANLPTSAPNFNFNSSTSTTPSFGFGSNATPATASITAPSSTTSSTFSFPVSSNSASVVTSKIALSVANTTASTSISASLFAAKPATIMSTATTSASTGFSFGATTSTASTAAPIASTFAFPTSTAKTTAMGLGGGVATSTFGNPLAKSPPSTSLAPTTSLPNFGSDKKDSNFSFGTPLSTNPSVSSAITTSQPPSMFGSTATATSSMFSSGINNTNPPPAYSAPATTTSAPATSTSMFGFGGASKPPGTFSFGATTASAATTASSTATPNFGSGGVTASTTGFGTPAANNSTATTSAPAFGTSTPSLFGAQTSAPSLFSSASSTTTANPMFKSPSTTSAFGAPQSAATSSAFGAPQSGATSSAFGAPQSAVTSSAFGAPQSAVTSSAFGAPQSVATTTASSSIFGAQSGVPSFGASAATTSAPSMFGNMSSTSASNTGLFGNAPAATTTTPSAFGGTQGSSIFAGANATTVGTGSIFGATTSAAPASGGLFSAASAPSQTPQANPADSSSSIFGQAKSPSSISFGGSTSAFGSTAASPSFAAPSATSPSTFQLGATPSTSSSLPSFGSIKPTSQFGSSTVTQPAVTSPGASIFGTTPSGSSFGANPAPPAFGAITNAPPAFGASSNAPPAFGTSTNAPPAFGANTNAPPSFGATGSTTSAFGSMPSSSAPSFGASSTSSFGSTGNATSPFGAPQPATTSTASLFGNTAPAGTSTAGPSANSSFGFGGSQTAQSAASQPTANSFAFGSTASAGGPGVFQFGGPSTASKPAGFNFNAPTSAPQMNFTGNTPATPAFNAPAPNYQPPGPNMFNIGSGSTTPRSRTSRSRRQR